MGEFDLDSIRTRLKKIQSEQASAESNLNKFDLDAARSLIKKDHHLQPSS